MCIVQMESLNYFIILRYDFGFTRKLINDKNDKFFNTFSMQKQNENMKRAKRRDACERAKSNDIKIVYQVLLGWIEMYGAGAYKCGHISMRVRSRMMGTKIHI